MTDDLVKRLLADELPNEGQWEKEARMMLHSLLKEAADRIEELEYALRFIAEVPIGAEIPDRTTIWGLATYMQETANDALKEGKDE